MDQHNALALAEHASRTSPGHRLSPQETYRVRAALNPNHYQDGAPPWRAG